MQHLISNLFDLPATHAAKAVRVFDAGGNLGLVRVEKVKHSLGFTSQALLQPTLALLTNVEHLGVAKMGLAGIRSVSAIHSSVLFVCFCCWEGIVESFGHCLVKCAPNFWI